MQLAWEILTAQSMLKVSWCSAPVLLTREVAQFGLVETAHHSFQRK
jgi:hypothetical protein